MYEYISITVENWLIRTSVIFQASFQPQGKETEILSEIQIQYPQIKIPYYQI